MIHINRESKEVTVMSSKPFVLTTVRADMVFIKRYGDDHMVMVINTGLEQVKLIYDEKTLVIFVDEPEWQEKYKDAWAEHGVAYAMR